MTSERDRTLNNAELYRAIRRGKVEKIEKLLTIVATDIVDANDKRNTPLHCAVEGQNIKIIDILLKAGANIKSINDDKKSPLDLARDLNDEIREKKDIVKILEASSLRSGTKRKAEMVAVLTDTSLSKLTKNIPEVPSTSGHATKSEAGSNSTLAEKHSKYTAGGLKHTSHGDIYQIKLLMLFLVKGVRNKYCFSLGTEWDAAEKFDDIIFEYKENGKLVYRFVQAKHRQDDFKMISLADLFNKDKDFSLGKYYNSYQKIIQNQEFIGANKELKDFIICTNIGFKYDDENDGFVLSEELFSVGKVDSIFNKPLLTFKDSFKGKQKIISVLKPHSELAKLVTALAECIVSGDKLDVNNILFSYQNALSEEVIDNKTKKLQYNFTDNIDLSPEAITFREAFFEIVDGKNITELKIDDVESLAKEMVEKMKNSKGTVIKVESLSGVIRGNLDKLCGHVLLIADNRTQFQFSNNFLNDNLQCDLNIFGQHLKQYSGYTKEQLGDCRFLIPKYLAPCDKIYLYKEVLKEKLQNDLPLAVDFVKYIETKTDDNNSANTSDDKPRKIKKSKRSPIQQLKLPNKSIYDDVSDFLAKLKFAVKQSNEVILSGDIKEIIGKYDSLYHYNAEIAFDYIFGVVLDWFKAKEGNFLTYGKGKKIFDDLYKILSSLIIIGNTTDYCSNIHNLHVSFDSMSTSHLEVDKFLQSENSVLFIINEYYTLLSAIKVHQTLTSKSELNKEGGFIFVDMSTMKNMQEKLLEAYSLIHEIREGSNLLVIDCKSTAVIESSLLVDLKNAVKQNAKNKLILLTLMNDIANFQFSGKIQMIDDKNSLCDFKPESQTNLLETKISFQVDLHQLGLNELVSEDDTELKKKIDPHLLFKLISKESIKLGDNIRDLGKIKDYYIERTVERRVKIKIECLSSDTNDIFAMDNVDDETVSKWRQNHFDIIMFNNMMDDFNTKMRIVLFDVLNVLNFEKLCQYYPNKNIHWVERRNNILLWRKSYGTLSGLRQYIDSEHISSSLIPQEINDINDNLVIIAAEPGMGKSTVLTHLANQTKYAHPSMWIVKINLLDHTKRFLQSAVNSKESAVDFLFGLLNLKTVFEHELIKSLYRKLNRLAILFDGYDEMTPFYKDKVIHLLKHLNDANVKLWVTTRTYMREQLEDGLSTLSYVLKPFTKTDQETFLKKLWSKHSTNEHLQGFIDKILKILSNLIQYNEDEFMGVPLLMQMIAEIFENHLIDGSSNLPEILNLKQLYDNFIERKWKIYTDEKKSGGNIASEIGDNEIIFDYFKHHHMLSALKTLFSDEECDVLLNDEQRKEVKIFIERINEGKEKTGIINQVVNGKLEFIHRTFAEYFAAQYFGNNFSFTAAKNLLSRYLFEDNKVMRHFFDRELTKNQPDSIHVAVLNRDTDKIVNLLKAPENATLKDKAGRTGLHLAAANGHKDVVMLWLEGSNTDLSQKDDLFGWSAICYAGKAKHWDIVDLLIANGADVSDVVEAIKDETKDKETEEILLHLAAKRDHVHLARALIRANVSLASVLDKNNLNRSPLHLAAKHKHLAMVKLLVENNANVNAADDDGSTSVHEAAFSGNLELLEYLISADSTISLDATDIYGRTPLYRAAENNRLKIMKFLLNKGMDVNNDTAFASFGERRKWTVLHVAAANGRADIFKFLIDRGAQQHLQDGLGRTPLDLAVIAGHFNLLPDMGATEKHRLHTASTIGRLDEVENILINKNNDDIKDLLNSSIYEWRPLHRAAMNDQVLIKKFLLEKGGDINIEKKDGTTPLIAASTTGSLNALKYLIDKNANLKATTDEGWTALHAAAQHGHSDIFNILVDKLGLDFNIDVADDKGTTLLHTAAFHGQLKMVKHLVENGAQLNKRDEFGATPLMASVLSNNQDVCKYLLKQTDNRQAYRQQSDEISDRKGIFEILGLTPLHAAVAYDAIEIVKILVEEHEMDINAGRGISATPLHLAAIFDSTDSIEYLHEKMADMDADINVENIWQRCSEAFERLHPTSGKEMMKTVIKVVVSGFCQLKKICGFKITAAFITRVMKYDNPIICKHPSSISIIIFQWFLKFPKFKQQIDLLKAFVERNKLGKKQPTHSMPFTVPEEEPK